PAVGDVLDRAGDFVERDGGVAFGVKVGGGGRFPGRRWQHGQPVRSVGGEGVGRDGVRGRRASGAGCSGVGPGHRAPPTSFSTYLAITSTSRFTSAPGSLAPSVVRLSVSGMRLTSNQSSPTAETVRLTPSTVMEPLCTTYRARPAGRLIRTTSQCSWG